METEATLPKEVNSCPLIFPPRQQRINTALNVTPLDKLTDIKEIEIYCSFADESQSETDENLDFSDDSDATMAGGTGDRAPGTLSRIKEFEDNVKALGDDLIEEKKKNSALEKELKKLEKSRGLVDEHKELKQKCKALEKDVKKLEKVKGIEDEYKELKREYSALGKEFKKLEKSKHSEGEYKELEKHSKALEKDIKKLTAEHENLKPKLIGAKTALDSIPEEKNDLNAEVMMLSTRFTATDTENNELKTQNAILMVENEKFKNDVARYKHENICKWKEEEAVKARIAEMQKVVEQHDIDAEEIVELKQGIFERGETITMNMYRIAALEQSIHGRELAIAALQAGQNAMARTEIERTLQIHRLNEQIATDQDHNRFLYDKLATEMQAYHANVYHLRMGENTEVPFPNAGGGYLCPLSSHYRRSYDTDVDRTGRAYMAQDERERRETAEDRARREAEERFRSETDAGLHRYGQLGGTVVGSMHLGMSGEQIGRAGVEAYYSHDPNAAGPFGYQGPGAPVFQGADSMQFPDQVMYDYSAHGSVFHNQEGAPGR